MLKTESAVLRLSLYSVLIFATMGITFGIITGSYAITFDGVFSLVDALMSVVSIVVATLIARSTAKQLSQRLQRRFTFGFWHFEPLVLALNGMLMIAIALYGLTQSIVALFDGGRPINFGPAVIYAVIILVLTVVVGTVEHRANKQIKSALVALDVKGWVMAGGVTGALLIAFIVGMSVSGTRFEWLLPYVDPLVLTVVSLVLIPLPVSTLRRALADIALLTPPAAQHRAEELAERVCAEHGFTRAEVFAGQVGRAQQFEVNFFVAAGLPAQPLEYWDDIRAEVTAELAGEDPNHWVTVTFSTRDSAESAQS